MDDIAALHQQIRRADQRNAVARGEIDRARSQILSLEERIAQLQRELAELEDFRIRSSRDLSTMREQADERKAAFTQLDSIPNVSSFKVLSAQIKDAIDNRTKYDIELAGSDIARQVNSAAGAIQREIGDLKARIASLEQAIAGNQSLIARNDLAISRLSAQLRTSS